MRNPFRRRYPPIGEELARGYAQTTPPTLTPDSKYPLYMSGDEFLAALDAEMAKPKPETNVHYLLGAVDRLACGAAPGAATHSSANPQAVTCGACKRTRLWKHNSKR